MSQILLIGLLASIPVAGLAWLIALSVEALGASLRLRLVAWTAALILPVALAPAMLSVKALDLRSPLAALREPSQPVQTISAREPQLDVTVATTPAPTPRPAPLPLSAILLGLIGAGAALRLSALALGLGRVARLAARSEAIGDPALAQRLGPDVRQAESTAPILAGVLRPVILLPRRLVAGLSADQAALVCAHERAHLAAGDHLSHLMEETLVRLFWFNPFLAAVRERLAAAREERCDARALAGCDESHRRAYAQTLIAALKLAGAAEPVAAFTGFRRRGAERRVRAILKPRGPGSLRAALTAGIAGLGLTAALGGVSLALAADPLAQSSAPARPAADAAPATPPTSATPAAPARPAHPAHHRYVIVTKKDGDGAKDGDPQTLVFDDAHHFDLDKMPDLTPEQRARIKADMDKAHAAMMQAMADSHQAMLEAHRQMADAHMLTAEERARIHVQVEDAMAKAHAAMAQNDGKVLMRCKLGSDGKATDCEQLGPGQVMMFQLHHGPGGPDGPMPPMPPMPPAPPAPGALPPPPPPPGG